MKKSEPKKAPGKRPAKPLHRAVLVNAAVPGRPDPTQRRPGSLSRSILGALLLFLSSLAAPATITVTGLVSSVTSSALNTKISFIPTENVLVNASGLNSGPALTITSTNGAFTTPLEPDTYLVRLPLIPDRRPFTITVPVGTGEVNITNLIARPWTYQEFAATIDGGGGSVDVAATNAALGVLTNNRTALVSLGAVSLSSTLGVTGTASFSGDVQLPGGSGSDVIRQNGSMQLANGLLTVDTGGHVTAQSFSGAGSDLTALSGTAITSGTVAESVIAPQIARKSEIGAMVATNNAAGATNLYDPELDSWVGVYFKYTQEKMYLTKGSLTSQRLIAGPIDSPASASFRDGSILYRDGTYYVAHTMNSFNETNKFAIIKSTDLLNWSAHYTFDCSGLSSQFNGNTIKQVWGPKWFTDTDGSIYITVAVSTNATATGMRAFLTKANDSTFSNWTTPLKLTNSLDIENFDGFIVKSNAQYQFWTRQSGPNYTVVHVSTNLWDGWTAWKTGDWAGWGSGYEGYFVHRTGAGRWTAILSDGGSGKQYYSTTTGDDFSAWTTPKLRADSVDLMNGGMVSVPGRALPALDYQFFPNGSNATTGQRFFMGRTTNPNQNHTLYLKGGTSSILALGGSTDTLIITDPEGVNTPFYLARRILGTHILMYNSGANNDLIFYGALNATNDVINAASITSTNIGPATSPTKVALSPRANTDTGIHFPTINEVSLVCNGEQALLANANDIYQVNGGFHSWVSSWGSGADVGITRTAAGRLSVNDGSNSGNQRDLEVRNLYLVSPTVPASAAASGIQGQVAIDANYIYICTAANTWKRVAIATW